MKVSWTVMKNLLHAVPDGKDLYLSLIDEDGRITAANTHMQRDLQLRNLRESRINFSDILHPIHSGHFRKLMRQAAQQKEQITAELFTKNKFYYPVKWQVNRVATVSGNRPVFFCIGYNLVDHGRQQKFSKLLEKHYDLVMEGLTGILFHDKEGELIAANQRASALLGTSFEELYTPGQLRRLWTEKWEVSIDDGKPLPYEKAPFLRALRLGRPIKEMFQVQLENGEQRWVLINAQPIPAPEVDGEGTCIVSHIIEVTNEKLLEIKLREKDLLINAFINQTPNLAWIVNEDARLLFASASFCRYFGIDPHAYVNRKVTELVPGPVFQSLYEKHVQVLESGKDLHSTEKIRLADGSNYISHVHLFPLEGFGGSLLVGGYAINIPDTSRLQTDLREANARLESLASVASDAIWEWDMQTGQIYRNETLMEMIGYQNDNAKGLSWWLRRIHPEDRTRVSDKVKEITENNLHSWQDEYRFKCSDGQYKHVRDKGIVIYENGLPVKMVGSLHDVSRMKELENRLDHEKLQRQQEVSETVIQVQEKERTRIGHELHDNVNQILSSARLFVDMLHPRDEEQTMAKEKTQQYLTMAIEEIRRLSREMVTPQFKELGLVPAIAALVEDLNLTNKIRFSFTHTGMNETLSSGKKVTLFRIVQEQTKNILTHSQASEAHVQLIETDDKIELKIEDNGIGFESSQTHRGIGLSNIYERISFYQGTVKIQTSPGKGCSVIVSLPVP